MAYEALRDLVSIAMRVHRFSYLALDVHTSECCVLGVLKDKSGFACLYASVVSSPFHEILATTFGEEVQALPRPGIMV